MTPAERPRAAGPLLEHLFRRQAGRMVSHFTRLLGPAHVSLAEDAVQEALLRALYAWPDQGIPENAAAWLTTSPSIRCAGIDCWVRRPRR